MKNNFCAPGKGDSISCFSHDALKKIATKWNEHNNNKINLNLSKKNLWSKINDKFRDITRCPQEWCWLETKYVKDTGDEILYKTFRPKRPIEWEKNPNTWLSLIL